MVFIPQKTRSFSLCVANIALLTNLCHQIFCTGSTSSQPRVWCGNGSAQDFHHVCLVCCELRNNLANMFKTTVAKKETRVPWGSSANWMLQKGGAQPGLQWHSFLWLQTFYIKTRLRQISVHSWEDWAERLTRSPRCCCISLHSPPSPRKPIRPRICYQDKPKNRCFASD